MCQSTSDKSIQLESCYISLQAVTLHPQPRYLSLANISQQSPCFPQQQYPDLELGQIVHRRKSTFHIPQSEISTGSRFFQPSLPVTIKRSPARSTLKIPSKVPPKFSPAGSMNKIFGGMFLDLYHL